MVVLLHTEDTKDNNNNNNFKLKMNFAYYTSDDFKGCATRIPISEIDGVKCHVSIEPGRDRSWVRMNIIAYPGDAHANQIAHNEKEFTEMIDLLKNYKFDKLKNTFVDGRKKQHDEDFYACLKSPTIKLDYEECCVCLENTRGKINGCCHPICLSCITHLKKHKCPLCRKKILDDEEFQERYCEDEDEDEDDE